MPKVPPERQGDQPGRQQARGERFVELLAEGQLLQAPRKEAEQHRLILLLAANSAAAAAAATTPLIDLRFGGVTFGRGGRVNNPVHSILPTGGAFDLPLPADAPRAHPQLPEYSLENGPAPAADDHAASVAAEIAHKIAEGKKIAEQKKAAESAAGSGSRAAAAGVGEQASSPSGFRAAALKSVTNHVEARERRAAEVGGAAKGPAGIDAMRVPNLWLAVAHSSGVKAGEVKKVEVDGVPIALWRTATGDVAAQSDVCIHRGASLARGWIANDRLVCPCKFFSLWREAGRRACSTACRTYQRRCAKPLCAPPNFQSSNILLSTRL